MATIDELDFKVILHDEEFDGKIQADIQLAKQFNTELSRLLEVKRKVTSADLNTAKNAERIRREQLKTAQLEAANIEKIHAARVKTGAVVLAAQEKIRREENKTASQAIINSEKEAQAKLRTLTAQQRLNDAHRHQNRLLSELGTYAAAYFSVRTVERFISSLVRVSGEFELQHTSLRAILGDIHGADHVFNQLQTLAVKSPFSFSDLTSYAKQLSAFSIPMNELYDTTKMLADVSAGLGVDMSRIILAYGQIRSASFLRGQEVRQLTEAGIPILEDLAKQFSEIEDRIVSVGEVFDKISAREVPFEMVAKVFHDMTSEGGKFYNMQEVQAETLKAKVKNLGDQYDIMLYQIGQAQDGLLKGAVGTIGNLMSHWQGIGRTIISVAAGFGTYAAVLAVVAVHEKILAAHSTIQRITEIGKRVGSLSKAVAMYAKHMENAGKAAKGAFAGSIIGIIAAVGVAIYQVARNAGELNRELNKIFDEKARDAEKLTYGFNVLVKRLKEANQGSENFRDAIHQLNNAYADYLPNLLTEANAYAEIAANADAARLAIRNKAKAEAIEKGKEAIESKRGGRRDKARDALEQTLENGYGVPSNTIASFLARAEVELADWRKGDLQTRFEALFNDYYGSMGFSTASYPERGSRASLNSMAYEYLKQWLQENERIQKDIAALEHRYGTRFGEVSYDSAEEAQATEAIKNAYETRKKVIYEGTSDVMVREKEYLQAEKDYLQKLIDLYRKLGLTAKQKDTQAKLDALNVVPTGRIAAVRDVLSQFGITSNKQVNWGLWADETTSWTDYYDNARKSYASIAQELTDANGWWTRISDGMSYDKANRESLSGDVLAAYDNLKKIYDRKKLFEAVAARLGFSITDKVKKAGSGGGSTKDPNAARIEQLKESASHLKDIQKVYESFKPFLHSDESMFNVLEEIYGEGSIDRNWLKEGGFKAAIDGVATELDKLGENGRKAADSLRGGIVSEEIKSKADSMLQMYEDSNAALEKTEDILERIFETMTDISGEDLQFAVSKIRDDKSKKDRKARASAAEDLLTLEAGRTSYVEMHSEAEWDAYYKNAKDAIDKWLDAELAANEAAANDRVKKLGSDYVTTYLKNKGLSADRIDKKGLSEIKKILDALSELTNKEIIRIILPEDVKNMKTVQNFLNGLQDDVKEISEDDFLALFPDDQQQSARELLSIIMQILKNVGLVRDETENVTDEKFWEKLKQHLNEIKSALDDLGDTLLELGENMGGSWGDIVGGLGSVAKATGGIISAYGQYKDVKAKIKSGDKSGAYVGGATMLIQGVTQVLSVIGNQIEENKQKQKEWELTVLETELAYRSLMIDKLDYKQSNPWGVESPYKKAIDGVKKYRAAAQDLNDTLQQLGAGRVQVGTKKVASGKNTAMGATGGALAGLGATALYGAAAGSAVGPVGTIIGAAAGFIVGGLAALFGAKKTVPVYESLLDHYGDLLDRSEDAEPFALNPKIIADYNKLDDATKKIVDHWDKVQGKMAEAKEALDETINDLSGDMGDKLQNFLLDAFRNNDLYSAIDEFHDYVSKMLESIISKSMFAAAFGAMFDDLRKKLDVSTYGQDSQYYEDFPDYANKSWEEIFSEFEKDIDKGMDVYGSGMEYWRDWGKNHGYNLFTPDDSEGGGGLGSGIKSITEDTANLLASYINGIRDDVSYIRVMQGDGWQNVKQILARMPSPTVWEYIASIEAHTNSIMLSNADIARSNSALLSELRSVITSENGAPSVRSFPQ